MKYTILKNTATLIFVSTILISCDNKRMQEGIESDIENPPTSQDPLVGGSSDSSSLTNFDASSTSRGKDSVKGEVTPPNAKEQ